MILIADATKNKDSVKLDEIMRLLFDVSKPILIEMLNSLFGENYDPELVDISKENAKFVKENLGIIEGDLFLRVTANTKQYRYHIECQTAPDGRMSIRMLEYDMAKAIETQKSEDIKAGRVIRLVMPKSIVIHIEESVSIPDKYVIEIVFSDGDIKRYIVPVMKYWTYDTEKLVEAKLYPLLPLQVFLLRAKLDRLVKDGQAKLEAIHQAKDAAERVAKEATYLYNSDKLSSSDLNIILNGVNDLFIHLNDRYEVQESLNEEVSKMLKTFVDPQLIEKGKIEGKIEGEIEGEHKGKLKTAQNLLKMGLSVEIVAKGTELSEKEVLKIKTKLKM